MAPTIKPITDDDIEKFDKLLDASIDSDCIQDFVESYLRYRDSGIDFVNSVNGAQEEIDVELETESEEGKEEGGNK